MAKRPPVFRPRGSRTRIERNQDADARRGSARKRGYSRRWEKASATHRRNHPLCEYCQLAGRVTPADLTDHLYPHKGDTEVFWLTALWVSSCTNCHSGFKQALERQGLPALDRLAHRLHRPTLAQALKG